MQRLLTFFLLFLSLHSFANKGASELYVDLQKLASLKKVLYIAAHPDDENTRLLAYLSLGEKAETAYLSLTRGDGGQNLIGDELGAELGVLRTQELLAARSYDGANQFFSRAVDFGYSKSAEESLDKWGKDELLSDVVLIIRKFQPDVIITRFPPDKRGGHGHHTASAILAIEAFEKAADPAFLPEQTKQYGAWKTSSIYWNTSYWWMKSIEDTIAKYPDKYFTKDIGGYNPHLGMSYNEIGTIARSQHKCQGFGAIKERGSRIEYFEHLGGDKLTNNFFEHATRSWKEIIDEKFEQEINALVKNFNFVNPEANVKPLLRIKKGLEDLPYSQFKEQKLQICNKLIIDCLGIYIEALSDDYSHNGEQFYPINLNIVNRSPIQITVSSATVNGEKGKFTEKSIEPNTSSEIPIQIITGTAYSTPYWLINPYQNMFDLKHKWLLGDAENAPSYEVNLMLQILNDSIPVHIPVEYKWRDPSYGERRRDLISVPAYAANFESEMLVIKKGEEKKLRVKVHNFTGELDQKMMLYTPEGWEVSPEAHNLKLSEKNEETWYEFTIKAGAKAENGEFQIIDQDGNLLYSYDEIKYDHIPTQSLIQEASIPAIKLDVEINEGKIAYIKGVDDAVPAAIEQLGFVCDLYKVSDLAELDLSSYRSVVLGIRIYNVHPELFNHNEKLYQYVESGGNLVMQYNTASRSIRDKEFGPAPFKLSRNRVTEEDAEVKFLEKNHPILNSPNKITKDDFKGWVQERGLYFAGEWSDDYKAIFAWNDKGEDPKKGALITMKYGKGQFIYTGISFFRELPKGVEGAYRLFANILSYESK